MSETHTILDRVDTVLDGLNLAVVAGVDLPVLALLRRVLGGEEVSADRIVTAARAARDTVDAPEDLARRLVARIDDLRVRVARVEGERDRALRELNDARMRLGGAAVARLRATIERIRELCSVGLAGDLAEWEARELANHILALIAAHPATTPPDGPPAHTVQRRTITGDSVRDLPGGSIVARYVDGDGWAALTVVADGDLMDPAEWVSPLPPDPGMTYQVIWTPDAPPGAVGPPTHTVVEVAELERLRESERKLIRQSRPVAGDIPTVAVRKLIVDTCTRLDDVAAEQVAAAVLGYLGWADMQAENARLRARVSMLEHYVGTTANRLGVDNPGAVSGGDAFELERIGEASLARIEKLRTSDYRYGFLYQLFVDTTGYEPSESELGGA